MRVGLFGGTFDPPHLGHLVTAVNVRHVLNLDLVVLMVANDPWQKHGTREVASAQDRLAMVQAAIAGVDGLLAGDDETSDTAVPRFLPSSATMLPPNSARGTGLKKLPNSRLWLWSTDQARL
jgi:cytidyltransferase-like protein